jgi:hypothetical protein
MTQTALVVRSRLSSPPQRRAEVIVTIRSVRPSLLDLRFSGDAWVVRPRDGVLVLCLGDSPLAKISALPLDQPSLNAIVDRARHRRPRWRLTRRTLRTAHSR